jgi:hypothetical protein
MRFSEYILKEDATGGATGAGAIGGTRGLLFGGTISRKVPMPRIPVQTIKYKKLANWNGYKKIHESDSASSFSSMDVISKLNSAQKHNDMQKDAVVYGIEGEHGEITKVYVAKDQDEEFKRALDNEIKDAENKRDVAEILFNLRDTFNILHVEWPPVPEDEEVNVDMKGQKGDEIEGELPPGTEGEKEPGKEGEGEGELPTDTGVGDIGSSGDDQSILFKVIDMLKADAEARMAEANAKAKEAEAKEAKYAANIADRKVKSEEDFANADSYFKQQQENKKASQRITKLAKYRQEISQSADKRPGVYSNESYKLKKQRMVEDATQEVVALQAQLSALNLKRIVATKGIDNQIRAIQQQLAIKTKQASQQSVTGTSPATNQTITEV